MSNVIRKGRIQVHPLYTVWGKMNPLHGKISVSPESHMFFQRNPSFLSFFFFFFKKEAFGLPLLSSMSLHPLFSTASIFSFDQSMTTPQMMVNSSCHFVSLGFRKHESRYMYVYSHICILTRKYLFSHRETLTYVAEEPEASKRFSVSEREPK